MPETNIKPGSMRIVRLDDLPFHVEQWDRSGVRIIEVLSKSTNALIGIAAFEEAIKLRKGEWIMLRHKTRVIRERRP